MLFKRNETPYLCASILPDLKPGETIELREDTNGFWTLEPNNRDYFVRIPRAAVNEYFEVVK